ncbi:orf 31 [Ateline gammaherpesvirus 3]|uniref:Orf 31 n=1 Tax=Ateline herpesvirus 3 TaxID=85618 RepID=Q9YTN5_ATHV3|nr:orf 31 [Ateline gammaherpesvirus 3]AAC95557.1 orf 31 [Ateline gammaherpesvirus 3]
MSTHQCQFNKLNTVICQYHKVFCLYQCVQCKKYHVCDGSKTCVLINTGESLVCMLTGNCIFNNFQESTFLQQDNVKEPMQQFDYTLFANILESLKQDLENYFIKSYGLEEVKNAIMNNCSLKPEIYNLIRCTFQHCCHIFGEIHYGYDIICSMYIHIIISIYSTKTVYGNLLFKCTKNKKYDYILKRMRETWMSTLITGDSGQELTML